MADETPTRFNTPDEIATYLTAACDQGDPAAFLRSLREVVREKRISRVARTAGMTRAGIYKALSEDGNPSFATIAKICLAVGVRFHIGMPETKAAEESETKTEPRV